MYIVSLQDREGCSMLCLLLKRSNKRARHFYQQNGFIQEQQINAVQDMQSVETTGKSGEQRRGAFCYKGKEHSVIKEKGELGWGCYKQSPLEETGDPFQWLSCESLTGCTVARWEEILPSSRWVVKWWLLPIGDAKAHFFPSVCNWCWVVGGDSAPFWPPDCILNEASVH